MPSNNNWACFDCRQVYRKPKYPGLDNLNCEICQNPCHNLGHKWRVPKKENPKAWEELKTLFFEEKKKQTHMVQREQKKLIAQIKSDIQNLEAKPPNKDRTKQIQELKNRLHHLT